MRYISIDLEMNQPSGKIIQIGAAIFDTNSKTPNKPIDKLNIYVDCGEDINWGHDLRGNNGTLGDLLGPDFQDTWARNKTTPELAFTGFWAWVSKAEVGKKLIQWGSGDVHELCIQSKEVRVPYPSRLQVMDVKKIYKFLYQPGLKLEKSVGGLQKVCEEIGIEFEGRAHDALNDAINTGKVVNFMFMIISGYGDIEKITKVLR